MHQVESRPPIHSLHSSWLSYLSGPICGRFYYYFFIYLILEHKGSMFFIANWLWVSIRVWEKAVNTAESESGPGDKVDSR